jgi:hypothetical protein
MGLKFSQPPLRCCRTAEGWHDPKNIYPEGFHTTVMFTPSIQPSEPCLHHCYVVGPGGKFWPRPTFIVVAADRPFEPLVAPTCASCWKAVITKNPTYPLMGGSIITFWLQ